MLPFLVTGAPKYFLSVFLASVNLLERPPKVLIVLGFAMLWQAIYIGTVEAAGEFHSLISALPISTPLSTPLTITTQYDVQLGNSVEFRLQLCVGRKIRRFERGR